MTTTTISVVKEERTLLIFALNMKNVIALQIYPPFFETKNL
jgi:hypothetical protein